MSRDYETDPDRAYYRFDWENEVFEYSSVPRKGFRETHKINAQGQKYCAMPGALTTGATKVFYYLSTEILDQNGRVEEQHPAEPEVIQADKVLWRAGKATVKELLENLPEGKRFTIILKEV